MDRSAQLRATLNSLAALNAANVVRAKEKYRTTPTDNKYNIKKVKPIENKEKQEEQKNDKK